MNTIPIHRHGIMLLPESERVIIRPFIPGNPKLIANTIGRMGDDENIIDIARG